MNTCLRLAAADVVEIPIVADHTRKSESSSKILRFARSERMLHWAIAGPFLLSFATGAILAILYNPDPSRPLRHVLALIHRGSGIALAILPMLALLHGHRDVRIHLYNIKQSWTWIYDDFKWLALMGLAAISSRFKLPEQGKFNAAEKLNFMVLMSTYPLYVVTGFLMWLIPLAVLSWIMHCLMAMMATPLVLGHLYMALINKDTRPGLEGMISGHVDRHWARHHYGRWYRKHFEVEAEQLSLSSATAASAVHVANSCRDNVRLSLCGHSLVIPRLIKNSVFLGHPNEFTFAELERKRYATDLVAVATVLPSPNVRSTINELKPWTFIDLCERLKGADDRSLSHAISRRVEISVMSFGYSGNTNLWERHSFWFPELERIATEKMPQDLIMTIRSHDCFLVEPFRRLGRIQTKLPEWGPNQPRLAPAESPSFWAVESPHFLIN